MPADSSWSGRRVVVVGASTGIGRELAVQAARAGAAVALCARRADLLAEAVTEAGGGTAIVADAATAEGCARIADEATAALGGPVDVLLYAAGVSPIAALREVTPDAFLGVLATNVVGASSVTAACLPHLAPGAIAAYLSSDSVRNPRHSLVPYAASKAALEVLVKGWRVEHPELRFANVVIGPTLGTDFGTTFDGERLEAAFPHWLRHGHVQLRTMDKRHVASVLLDSLAAALANPSVEVQEVVLRPPGPLAGSVEEMLAAMAEEAP